MSVTVASPITFKHSSKTAPNRFLKSAMTERLCTYDDKNHDERGKPTPEYIKLYEEWGKGAIGIIVLGNLPVDRTQLEAKKNMIIDPRNSWDAVSALKPVIQACKAHGSLVIGQLTNGGRQTSQDINEEPYSSSSEQCPPMGGMVFNKPRPMTIAEIDTLVESFAFAAKVLYDAGADGAQLHGAHGYLLSQFLSARVNKRTDDYGGSLENRARIILRIIDAIKERVPKDFILSIKMNSADFSEGGLTDEESRTVASWLDAKGLDLIELSGGTYEQTGFEHKKESTKAREGFFVEFSEQMKPLIKEARIAVTGGFRSADAMNKALQDGATDIIGLARPLTAEPYLCREIIEGKKTKAKENKVNPGVQTATSVYQLGQISRGEPIADLSDEKTAEETFLIAIGKKSPQEKPVSDQDTSTYTGNEKPNGSHL